MKTKEEIEQLAEKEYREYPNNPIDKEDWYYNKDNNCHRKRKAFVKGYYQSQENMADYIFEVAFQFHRLGKYYGNTNDNHFTDIYEETINSLNKQD